MPLILHSEPRPPTGGVGATGALNSLGRPDIDFWPLYVRETLQNTWDARRTDTGRPVSISYELRRLTWSQAQFLAGEVFAHTPEDGRSQHWRQLVSNPTVVTVRDANTTGMGGPTRADVADPSAHDFADFIWNIGQAPDKDLGGGTYGYGKSVYYLGSQAHTILVYTGCETDQGLEARLIVSSWGEEFTLAQGGRLVPFTGRHWWGGQTSDRRLPVAPLIGEEAHEVAEGLGLDRLAQTGTAIMILAAEVPDGDEWGATVADAVAWHCWPKLLDLGDGPEMTVRVSVGDRSVKVPDPRTHPELSHFATCLATIADGQEDDAHRIPIRLQRPATRTGWLGIKRIIDGGANDQSPARPFEGPVRHVALMRAPRLVVRYMQGIEPPIPFTGWAGVFIAEDEHDRAFAMAEPPAHDDWVPRAVEHKPSRRIVNVTLRRIVETTRELLAPRAVEPPGEGTGLGALADRLGGLLPVAGPGPADAANPGGGSGSVRRSRATVTSSALEATDRGLVLVADVDVLLRDRVETAVLSMDVDVATSDGGGVEREAPEGAEIPRLLGWVDPQGGWVAEPCVPVSPGQATGWRARISVPRDTAVVLRPQCRENTDA